MENSCLHCGTTYSRPPSLIGQYCSKSCAYAHRLTRPTKHRRISYRPGHPLAGDGGYISEARAVLFDAFGWGPHPCHWCGVEVDWKVGVRGQPADALVADHLESGPLDDRLENLVLACGRCNGQRGRPKEFPVTELRCEKCQRAVYAAYKRKPPILCRNCKRKKA